MKNLLILHLNLARSRPSIFCLKIILNSQKVDLYYWDEYPANSVLHEFDDYVRANLLPAGPDEIQNRIIDGSNLTLRSSDGKRQFDENIGFIVILFPLAVGMFFIFAVMGASGYFLQAITDEKENRTMEIAITSLSPWQLISGKSIGLIGVALTQITIWLASIAVAWMIALRFFPEIQGLKTPLGYSAGICCSSLSHHLPLLGV